MKNSLRVLTAAALLTLGGGCQITRFSKREQAQIPQKMVRLTYDRVLMVETKNVIHEVRSTCNDLDQKGGISIFCRNGNSVQEMDSSGIKSGCETLDNSDFTERAEEGLSDEINECRALGKYASLVIDIGWGEQDKCE